MLQKTLKSSTYCRARGSTKDLFSLRYGELEQRDGAETQADVKLYTAGREGTADQCLKVTEAERSISPKCSTGLKS